MRAAIDVGSNTVRMLIGHVDSNQVIPHRYERRITRLKGGQDETGLTPDATERTLSALSEFKRIADQHALETIRIVGTEALRSAPNGSAFREEVARELALEIDIIDGHEEARLSAAGALAAIRPVPERSVILDIGGGSSEIAVVESREVLFQHSCALGVVRLDVNRFYEIEDSIYLEQQNLPLIS